MSEHRGSFHSVVHPESTLRAQLQASRLREIIYCFSAELWKRRCAQLSYSNLPISIGIDGVQTCMKEINGIVRGFAAFCTAVQLDPVDAVRQVSTELAQDLQRQHFIDANGAFRTPNPFDAGMADRVREQLIKMWNGA